LLRGYTNEEADFVNFSRRDHP